MKIEIFDTTLRDGTQGTGVEFSPDDKRRVIRALDDLGVTYIECGMITDTASAEFFSSLADLPVRHARLAVFTQTCKAGEPAAEDALLSMAAAAPVPVAVIYGKAWLYQVTDVLRTTPEENLRMIRDSIRYLRSSGKEVIFDAEHFFDGYSDQPSYAMEVVRTAFDAGASRVVLCDTNGGMLPDVIGLVTAAVCGQFDHIGIHCHNDMGMAVSCSVSAVLSGACHVHGTVSGVGERCGNANLNTLIPVLQCKLGFDCIRPEHLRHLTQTARTVHEAANLAFDENEPFVGGYAFTHKAGAHIDGVRKTPRSFEHINPATVGNSRNIVVSGLSGRAAILDKLQAWLPDHDFQKSDPAVIRTADLIRAREADGFDYESAGASLSLLMEESLGRRKRFFRLVSLKVLVDEASGEHGETFSAAAVIKIAACGREYLTAGEGNGPVNAIDQALRRALTRFYPEIEHVRLTDYRVRVLDTRATASKVRVSIESTDGVKVWRTVGVSVDVIHASWQALCDSVEFYLRDHGGQTETDEDPRA